MLVVIVPSLSCERLRPFNAARALRGHRLSVICVTTCIGHPCRVENSRVSTASSASDHPFSYCLDSDRRALIAQVEFPCERRWTFSRRLRALQGLPQAFAKCLFFIAKRHRPRTVAPRARSSAHCRLLKYETDGYEPAPT